MLDVAAETPPLTQTDKPAPAASWLVWPTSFLAFLASGATLVLELVAGRMLAPYVGVSLYTWTSIIGVVLAGVSLGNWLGGKLADRRPSIRALGEVFLGGGLASLATLGLVGLLGDSPLLRSAPLLPRIFVLTTAAFLAPSLLLGMATPLAIRLALRDVRGTGRVVGMIYAFGTLGSLVGNFLTGFVLTAFFTVASIVIGTAVLLLAVGLALRLAPRWGDGERWRDGEMARWGDREMGRWGDGATEGDGGMGGDGETPGEMMPRALARGASPPGGAPTSVGSPHPPTAPSPHRPIPPSPLSLAGNPVLASAVVVISSFCTMAIELAASRIMAPTVGLSLYSWTGIIGTVLAGIAVGNYLGGRIADRWPRQGLLGLCLFIGGLASFSILPAMGLLEARDLFGRLGLMERIVLLTAGLFFLPVLMLGTISPQAIRLAVRDLAHAGRVSGVIYAWSTAGAIVGTFATGWWLISALGVRALVFAMGLVLLLLALAVGRVWQRPLVLAASLVIIAGSVFGLASRDALASTCTRETNYFCIRVQESLRDDFRIKTLILDHLIHSYVKIGDPSYLGYEHEYIQAEVTRYQLARTDSQRVLLIGGGGYTYPRWVEATLPQAMVEVVEIDPGVTDVVYDELGLPRDTGIVSYNLDGRQFVREMAPRGHYSVIVQDAVNDLSVPYHIMTKEYNDQVRSLLVPDGVYLLTVIDLFEGGQLLRAAARTMQQTFPRVQLFAANRAWDVDLDAVWVLAGSDQGVDLEQMNTYLRAQGVERVRTLMLEPERLQLYVNDGPQIILTDQYAPVDNLIAPLFTRRF